MRVSWPLRCQAAACVSVCVCWGNSFGLWVSTTNKTKSKLIMLGTHTHRPSQIWVPYFIAYACVCVCAQGKTFMFIVAIKTTSRVQREKQQNNKATTQKKKTNKKKKIKERKIPLDSHFPLEFVHKTNWTAKLLHTHAPGANKHAPHATYICMYVCV